MGPCHSVIVVEPIPIPIQKSDWRYSGAVQGAGPAGAGEGKGRAAEPLSPVKRMMVETKPGMDDLPNDLIQIFPFEESDSD